MSHMIHGPCGPLNLTSSCMGDGKCSKKYPRAFVKMTTADNNGYPTYRRRENGRTHILRRRNIQVDNRLVVPYNPYLCLCFDAHVNVEICSSVKTIKYLYKYIYK